MSKPSCSRLNNKISLLSKCGVSFPPGPRPISYAHFLLSLYTVPLDWSAPAYNLLYLNDNPSCRSWFLSVHCLSPFFPQAYWRRNQWIGSLICTGNSLHCLDFVHLSVGQTGPTKVTNKPLIKESIRHLTFPILVYLSIATRAIYYSSAFLKISIPSSSTHH